VTISYVGVATTSSGGTAGTAVAMNLPSGAAAGDVLVAFLGTVDSSSLGNSGPNGDVPAGWSSAAINTNAAGTARVRLRAMGMVYSSGSSWTSTLSSSGHWVCHVVAYRDSNGSASFSSGSAVAATTTAATASPPAVSPVTSGVDWVVNAYAVADTFGHTWTEAGSPTERADTNTGTGSLWSSLAVADSNGSVSGSTQYVGTHDSTNSTGRVGASIVITGSVPPGHVSDSFTRADSSTTMGSATTGQVWANSRGTWGISSNQCYNPVSGAPSAVTIGLGSFNGVAEVTLTATGASTECAIWFRWTDFNNTYFIDAVPGGHYQLFKRVAGTQTTLVTGAANCASGDTVRVQFSGSSIKTWVNGVPDIDTTDSSITSGTFVGLRNGADTSTRYDNFMASPFVTDVASASATAYGATVSTATAVTAAPGSADGSATAFDPTLTLASLPDAGAAAGTAAANDPTVLTVPIIDAPAGAASATGTAYDPALTQTSSPGASSADGAATAYDPTAATAASTDATSGAASGSGVAQDPAVEIGTLAMAGSAEATASAGDSGVSIGTLVAAGTAVGAVVVYQPTFDMVSTTGGATSYATAFNPRTFTGITPEIRTRPIRRDDRVRDVPRENRTIRVRAEIRSEAVK